MFWDEFVVAGARPELSFFLSRGFAAAAEGWDDAGAGQRVVEHHQQQRRSAATAEEAYKMFRKVGVLAALAVPLAIAPAAHANPPDVTVVQFEDTTTNTALCGFPIELHFEGEFTLREFFDQDGDLARIQFHSPDVATATNSEGVSITGHEVVNIHVDFTKGVTESKTGLPLHFNGVLMEAGRIFFDADGNMTLSGNHQLAEGDLDQFCAALS